MQSVIAIKWKWRRELKWEWKLMNRGQKKELYCNKLSQNMELWFDNSFEQWCSIQSGTGVKMQTEYETRYYEPSGDILH